MLEDYKPIEEITVRRKQERKMVKKLLIAQLIPFGAIIGAIIVLIVFMR